MEASELQLPFIVIFVTANQQPCSQDCNINQVVGKKRKKRVTEKAAKKDSEFTILIAKNNSEILKYFKSHLENKSKSPQANHDKGELVKKALEQILNLGISDKISSERDESDLFLEEKLFIWLEQLAKSQHKLKIQYAFASNPPVATPQPVAAPQPVATPQPVAAPQKQPLPVSSANEIFLQKIDKFVTENLSNTNFRNTQLAAKMHISKSQLFRKIKKLTGQSPAVYSRSIRLQKAKDLLQNTNLSISEITYTTGFNDPSYFSRIFSKEFGVPPSSMRK